MNKIKKLITSSFVLLLLYAVSCTLSTASAATPTVVPSQNEVPKDSADLEKIQKIKDIVASKVAELNLVEKRGLIGTLKEVNGMRIVITDLRGNSRQIEADELTKFNLTDKNAGISDLKKGERYSFIGLYNKETEILLARNISNTNSIPVHFEGAILSVDEDEFQIEVVNAIGEKKKIDIQSSTKTSLVSPEGDLTKSGFSKLEINSRVLVVGFWNKKDDSLMSATRVIHFEDVPPSKEMQSHVPSPTADKE